MKETMRDLIKSCKLFGVAGIKTFYMFKKEPSKEFFDGRPQNDDIQSQFVPLMNLLKDRDCSWTTSPWIAHEIHKPIQDIRKKFKLNKNEKITVTRSTKGTSDMPNVVKSEFQFGTYWEIEDRANGKKMVIVSGVDRFVEKPTDVKYPEGMDTMWDFLQYNDIPNRPRVYSDYYFWRPQLEQVTLFNSMLINHGFKGVSKYKWIGPKPNETQKAQLRSSKDSSVVELEPGQDVVQFNHAGIDPQTFVALNSARSDIALISKQAPRQNVGGDKTATEVKAIEFAAQEVESESLERLNEVMESIANKQALLIQDNYKTSKAVRISGMSDAEFLQFKENIGDRLEGSAKSPFIRVDASLFKGKKVKALLTSRLC